MVENRTDQLSDEDVIEIRETFNEGETTATELSVIFQTSRQNINKIIDGDSFKHLEIFPRTKEQVRSSRRTEVTPEMVELIRENQDKRLGYLNTFKDSGFDCRKTSEALSRILGITPRLINTIIRKHNLLTITEQHEIDIINFSKADPKYADSKKPQSLTEKFLEEIDFDVDVEKSPHEILSKIEQQNPNPTPEGWFRRYE